MAFDSSWKVLQFGFWLRLNRSKRPTVNSLKRFLSATHFAKSWDFPTERLTGLNCCNSEYRQFKNSEIDFSFICSRPEGAFSRHIVLFASRKLAATERKAKEKKIKVSGFGNVAEQGPWRIYSSGKARDPILSGGLRLGASESTASRPSIRSASNRPVHNETFISSLFVFVKEGRNRMHLLLSPSALIRYSQNWKWIPMTGIRCQWRVKRLKICDLKTSLMLKIFVK